MVTFELPAAIWAENVALLGEFNDWDVSANPLMRQSDGTWSATLELERNREYQFRYLIDGRDWLNDGQADSYVRNPFGEDNSVVSTHLSDNH